jgi:NADH:ubiquinone oxidoreductase subunit 4 (subunit M)
MNALAEFTASLTSNVALLLVLMPLIGAGLVRLMSRAGNEPAWFTAMTNVWLCCGLVVLAVLQLEPLADFEALFQPRMLTSLDWPGVSESQAALEQASEGPSTRLKLRVDGVVAAGERFPSPRISVAINGLNLWFVALAVAATTAAVRGMNLERSKVASRLSWVLLTEAALIGTLVAQDVVLLSGFNLLAVVGLFFLIGYSASPDRRSASRRFFRVQFVSAIMLSIGLAGAAVSHWWMMLAAEIAVPVSFSLNQIVAQVPDLSLTTEAGRAYWNTVSPWLFPVIVGACIARVALPPLHHWWLQAVEQADRATSCLIACGYCPVGIYLAARIVVPLFPERLAELSARLTAWSLIAAALLAVIGLKLADSRRDASLESASRRIPGTGQTARLIGTAMLMNLSIAFGAVILASPLTIRGGLLIAVSSTASTGLAFWLIPDDGAVARGGQRFKRMHSVLSWLVLCGLVALPVSGTFWGLLMAAHGFMRQDAALTLLLITVVMLFAGTVLRTLGRRNSAVAGGGSPGTLRCGIVGLLPLTAVVILAATSPALICGPPPQDESESTAACPLIPRATENELIQAKAQVFRH